MEDLKDDLFTAGLVLITPLLLVGGLSFFLGYMLWFKLDDLKI